MVKLHRQLLKLGIQIMIILALILSVLSFITGYYISHYIKDKSISYVMLLVLPFILMIVSQVIFYFYK